MSSITRSFWIFMILGCSAVALAQAPAGEEPASVVDTADAAAPCVMAGESLPQGLEQDGETPDAVPCEEQAPEAIPEAVVEDAFADTGQDELKTTGDDVTAQEEFETREEISEDFPVPLPSDI
jgi:hypothetical protein